MGGKRGGKGTRPNFLWEGDNGRGKREKKKKKGNSLKYMDKIWGPDPQLWEKKGK